MYFKQVIQQKNHQISLMSFSMKVFLIAPLQSPSNLAAHFVTHFFKSSAWFGSYFSYFLYLWRIVKARLFYMIYCLSSTDSSSQYLRNPLILSFEDGDAKSIFSISNSSLGPKYKFTKYALSQFLICFIHGIIRLYSSSVSIVHILLITLYRKLLISIQSKCKTISHGKTTIWGNFLLFPGAHLRKYKFSSFSKYFYLISLPNYLLQSATISIRSTIYSQQSSNECKFVRQTYNLFLKAVYSTISRRYLDIFCLSGSEIEMMSQVGMKFWGFWKYFWILSWNAVTYLNCFRDYLYFSRYSWLRVFLALLIYYLSGFPILLRLMGSNFYMAYLTMSKSALQVIARWGNLSMPAVLVPILSNPSISASISLTSLYFCTTRLSDICRSRLKLSHYFSNKSNRPLLVSYLVFRLRSKLLIVEFRDLYRKSSSNLFSSQGFICYFYYYSLYCCLLLIYYCYSKSSSLVVNDVLNYACTILVLPCSFFPSPLFTLNPIFCNILKPLPQPSRNYFSFSSSSAVFCLALTLPLVLARWVSKQASKSSS